MQIKLISGIILIIIVGLLLYSHTFDYQLTNYRDNQVAVQKLSFETVLKTLVPTLHKKYTPIKQFSYILDSIIYGGVAPDGFHKSNVIYFLILAIILFSFLLQFFAKKFLPSIVGALLFLAHPFNADIVSSVGNRGLILMGIFLLASFTLYLYSFKKFKFPILRLYLLALLSHPLAITAPIFFLVHQIYVVKKSARMAGQSLRYIFISGLLYGLLYLLIIGQAGFNILSSLSFIGKASLLLLYPKGLAVFYNFSSLHMLIGIIILVVIFVLIFNLKNKMGVALAWLGISCLPLLFVTHPSNRHLLTVLIGIALLIGLLIDYLCYQKANKWLRRLVCAPLAIILIFYFTVFSYNHSRLWASSLELWQSSYQNQANYLSALYYAKSWKVDKEDTDRALEYLDQAIEFKPDCIDAYQEKAILLQDNGKFKEATEVYNTILDLEGDKHDPFILLNLGKSYLAQNELEQAAKVLKKALELKPNLIDATNRLAYIKQRQEKQDSAAILWRQVINDDPTNYNAFYNLAIHETKSNNLALAMNYFQKVEQLNPNMLQIYPNMGSIYETIGNYEEAIDCYQKYISLSNNRQLNNILIQRIDELEKLNQDQATVAE